MASHDAPLLAGPDGRPGERAAAADGGLPLPSRVLATLTAPRRLFAGFDERTPWMGALALSIGAAMVGAATQPAEFFLEQMDDPVNRLGKPVEVTSTPAEIVRWGRYLAVFSALAGHPLVLLGTAGVLTLGFTVLGGGRGSFRVYLAIAAHALLVAALGTLVAVGLRAVTGDAALEPTLARLLQPLTPAGSLAHRLLDGVNLFTLWTLAVLAAGVAAVDGRRSWRGAAGILLGGYLLLATASTLLAG